jgi:hypothetical protein
MQLLFFALKVDLLPVLDVVESQMEVQYSRTGRYSTSAFVRFLRAADIPGLGSATADSTVACETYLITARGVSVNVRTVESNDGKQVFFVDQLVNPDSITVTPAGSWGNETVLSGRFATASTSAAARHLMNAFGRVVKSKFEKIGPYRVGREALAILDKGGRLTDAVQSPREFDLVR